MGRGLAHGANLPHHTGQAQQPGDRQNAPTHDTAYLSPSDGCLSRVKTLVGALANSDPVVKQSHTAEDRSLGSSTNTQSIYRDR